MQTKNPKNSHEKESFEDVYSTKQEDRFQDISSGADHISSDDAPVFEDFFTGREKEEETPFDSAFFTDMDPAEKKDFQKEAQIGPEKEPLQSMPYHYNYLEGKESHRAQNGDEIFSMCADAPKKPKKHRGKAIALSILSVFLVLVLLLCGIGYGTLRKMLSLVDTTPLKENAFVAQTELLNAPDVKNILLIGSDARENEDAQKTRSDTMLLISIDKKNKQIKMVSFLRDLYVSIPGYRKDKINAAHSHGGSQLLVDTIESEFKIDIDGYVLVTFDIFKTLIDVFDGVDVEITEKEANYINSKDHMTPEDVAAFPEKLHEGKVHLTGAQALWYSRIRYLDSDFMRTARQRKVFSALLLKATKKGPSALLSAAKKALPLLKTSYSGDELWDLGMEFLACIRYPTVEMQIPAKDAYKSQRKRGQACLVPDLEKNKTLLHAFLLEEAQKEEEPSKSKTN